MCEFPNPDGKLRPGQFGRVRMPVALLDDALLVPQRAVVERQGVKSVMVVDAQNKVALKTITITERYEGQFVVQDGLEGNERVIVGDLQKAVPGSTVVPSDKASSGEPDDTSGNGGDE